MTEPPREAATPQGPTDAAIQPSGGSRPASPRLDAPTSLAIASMLIAVALTAVEVATAIAAGPAVSEYREALQNDESTADIFTWYERLELLLLPVFVAAYVVSCLWLQFARSIALVISGPNRHQRGPVWVWLGWWVPIVSFWFPYQVVRDVRNGSSIRRRVGLGLWWTSWLIYLFGDRASGVVLSLTDDDLFDAVVTVEWITSVAAVIACVQWCRIVHSITASQRRALAARDVLRRDSAPMRNR